MLTHLRPPRRRRTVPRDELAGDGERRERAHRRRADQPAAPQDRGRSGQSRLSADGARHRLPPARRLMTGMRRPDGPRRRPAAPSTRRLARAGSAGVAAEGALRPLADHHHRADGAPAIRHRLRLHGAALADGDAPAVGGRDRTTSRRSSTSSRAIPQDKYAETLAAHRQRPARPRRRYPADGPLPPPGPKPFFSILDSALSREIRTQIGAAVLDRHGRALQPRRDPHPARRRRAARVRRGAARPMPRTRTSSCSGWSAPRWCCSPSRSCSCATRSGRS